MPPRGTAPTPPANIMLDDDVPLSATADAALVDLAAREAALAAREADFAGRMAALNVGSIAGTAAAEAASNSAKLGPSVVGAPVGMPTMARIILEETENMAPTGQTFSLNGRAYLIRPGEEVTIPMGILEIIDNAVEARAIHDPQSLKVVGYRARHRFPYRRLPDRVALSA